MTVQAALEIFLPEGEIPLALNLPEGLTIDELRAIGKSLFAFQKAAQWRIGDWWNYVVEHHGEDTARRLTNEIWGVEGETARVYGWVAEKFDPVNRLTSISFTHYQRAASLPHDDAHNVIEKAAREGWSVRDVTSAVQAVKAVNDPGIGSIDTGDSAPRPKTISNDLMESYARYAELAEKYEKKVGQLDRRDADWLAFVVDKLDRAHGERREVPADFRIKFREQGRVECERIYKASRLTINHWLFQCGKPEMIADRAAFVQFQRSNAQAQHLPGQPEKLAFDTYLPVARMAADFMRQSRNGGWMISQREAGGWLIGTVYQTSEQLIARAERQGFNRQAAVTEAREEGY